jgi:hypothetical protein
LSHLKSAIQAVQARPAAPIKLRAIPAVKAAAERLKLPEGAEQRRDGKNYDALAREFLNTLPSSYVLTSKQLREAAWCLWATNPALSEHPAALRAALDRIEASGRKPPGRALASSFMASFSPEKPGIAEASEVLSRLAEHLGRPWSELQREYRLFDWRNGPQRIARRSLDTRSSPTAVLTNGGLGALGSQSGYARVCAGLALKQIAEEPGLAAEERLALVKDLALDTRGKLVFDEHSPDVANALVLPFGDALPEKAIRDRYLALLLDLFKDPRLYEGRWARMPKAAEKVCRWLAEQSLRQFLDVVDQVALEHMWVHRRAFWEAVYREGLIAEAWVVFEQAGASAARAAFGKDVSFAMFDGGVQSGQAVLLLRIGRGIVAEWSHSGKCIIWNDAEAPEAPRLYKGRYRPFSLRSSLATDALDRSVFGVTHWPHEGPNSWQRKVAAKLHQMTGVRISPAGYEIR